MTPTTPTTHSHLYCCNNKNNNDNDYGKVLPLPLPLRRRRLRRRRLLLLLLLLLAHSFHQATRMHVAGVNVHDFSNPANFELRARYRTFRSNTVPSAIDTTIPQIKRSTELNTFLAETSGPLKGDPKLGRRFFGYGFRLRMNYSPGVIQVVKARHRNCALLPALQFAHQPGALNTCATPWSENHVPQTYPKVLSIKEVQNPKPQSQKPFDLPFPLIAVPLLESPCRGPLKKETQPWADMAHPIFQSVRKCVGRTEGDPRAFRV